MPDLLAALLQLMPMAVYRMGETGCVEEAVSGIWHPPGVTETPKRGTPCREVLPPRAAAAVQHLLDTPGAGDAVPPMVDDTGGQACWIRAHAVEREGRREVVVVLMDLAADSPAALYDFLPRAEAAAAGSRTGHAAVQATRLRSLGEMASGLVHEFSQPVSGIRGFAEGLLLSKQRGWEVSERELLEGLDQIIQLTGRMSELIDHVRGFASSGDAPERMEVDLSDVIDSALMMIATQFRRHGIEIRVEAPETPLRVLANVFLLEEAVLALLANARDALEDMDPAREPCVTIRLRSETDATACETWAVLEVADNGPGIPLDVQDRVLDPFFTTKGPDRGVGLGLNRVRRTAELSGGAFSLTSTPGVGTMARMAFPLAAGGEREPA